MTSINSETMKITLDIDQVQQQCIVPPPMDLPLISLPLPELKLDPTTHKLMQARKGNYGTKEQEMSEKHKKVEDLDPNVALQGQSTGDNLTLNITLLYKCQSCENWNFKHQKYMHESFHASEILPFLYLGGSNSAANLKEIKDRLNINMILNCAIEEPNVFEKDGFFQYIHLDLDDNLTQDISRQFQRTNKLIQTIKMQNKKILVHCAVGKSRSATIVLAYLMKNQGKNLKEAYQFVKQRRPIVAPNANFIQKLLQYEKKLYGSNSIKGEEILPLYKFLQKQLQI